MSTCASSTFRLKPRILGSLLGALTVALVPVSYGLGFALTGVPSALGCSPIDNTPGITGISVPRDSGAQQIAVASDGFFMIEVSGVFATPQELLASVALEVTSASGEAVAGSLHPFPSAPGLYWLADAALADGNYTATVSAPANPELPEQRVQLTAKGAASELALPLVEPRKWLEYHHLTGGKQFSCATAGLCTPAQFGELEETSPGVDLRFAPSEPINGQVYWEISAKQDSGASSPFGSLMRDGDETGGELRLDHFASEYCVVVTVRNRRDDRELTAPPTCWKPGALEVADETGVISACSEPPTEELRPVWCKFHREAPECQGISVTPPGSAGRSGNAVEDDGVRSDDASSACSIGYARGRSSLGLASLLAVAVLAVRRERARRTRR